MHGWELRERRRAAGLTLRQVARAAGTAESNVAAYERGAKVAHVGTVDRILAVIDVGAGSPVHRQTLLTFPAAASELRRGLRAGRSTADLLRLVRELRSNFGHLRDDADRAAYFARPSTTGDQRWDAMLAGNAEDLSLQAACPRRRGRPVTPCRRSGSSGPRRRCGPTPSPAPPSRCRSVASWSTRAI